MGQSLGLDSKGENSSEKNQGSKKEMGSGLPQCPASPGTPRVYIYVFFLEKRNFPLDFASKEVWVLQIYLKIKVETVTKFSQGSM